MTLPEAIAILELYQQWRLGADIPMPRPSDITEAISIALHLLKQLK